MENNFTVSGHTEELVGLFALEWKCAFMMLRKQRQQEEIFSMGGPIFWSSWEWSSEIFEPIKQILHYCLEELRERWDTSCEKKKNDVIEEKWHLDLQGSYAGLVQNFPEVPGFWTLSLSQFTPKKNYVKWRWRRKTASYWWKVDIAQLNQCISPEIPVWLFLDRTHRDLLVLSSLQTLSAAGASACSAAGTLLVDLCTKSAPNLAKKR